MSKYYVSTSVLTSLSIVPTIEVRSRSEAINLAKLYDAYAYEEIYNKKGGLIAKIDLQKGALV